MSGQLALTFPAGSQAPDTSADAADALTGEVLSARRMRVLKLIAAAPDGLTADEVVAKLGGRHNTFAPRVTELLQVGLVERTKQRRATRSGGSAYVHVVSPRGRAYLEAESKLWEPSRFIEDDGRTIEQHVSNDGGAE